MVFFLKITNIWHESQDIGFAEFFFLEKIHRLVWIFLWIFGCFECVSLMFCFKLYLKFYKRCLSPPPLQKKIYWLVSQDFRQNVTSISGSVPRMKITW